MFLNAMFILFLSMFLMLIMPGETPADYELYTFCGIYFFAVSIVNLAGSVLAYRNTALGLTVLSNLMAMSTVFGLLLAIPAIVFIWLSRKYSERKI